MLYSKGDTIDFTNGSVGLVLDDGITNQEFCHHNSNTDIYEVYSSGATMWWRFDMYEYPTRKEIVWYNVLIGDTKAWYRWL